MAGDSRKWPGMTGKGRKWSGWPGIDGNGLEWLGMVERGQGKPEIASGGPRFVQWW